MPVELQSLEDKVTLANGTRMPRLGFGTYRAEGPDAEDAVSIALDVGYRGVDTASLYNNETAVGRAIRDSGVPRSEIFLATKVWNDEQGYRETRDAFERSLEKLGTDYVDLYLIHWPIGRIVADTWRAMEEILDTGAARAIGVCNFLEHHIEQLRRTARVMPMVDQVEHHPSRNFLLGHRRDVGDEVGGELLPAVPGEGGLPPQGEFGRVQTAVVGGEDVGFLGLVEDREEIRPSVGEDSLGPSAERPVDLGLAGEEDAAKDQPRAAFRVCLGVGEAERADPPGPRRRATSRAPGARESARVGHEVGGRVLANLARGVERPEPRWSKRITRQNDGSKKRRWIGEIPAPGPPWKKTTGLPAGFPACST